MADINQRQMAKSKEQSKVRVLVIAKMLNEGRRITSAEILRRLDLQYDIQADRRTIYSDIRAINRIMPIESTCGRCNGGFKKYDVMGAIENGK